MRSRGMPTRRIALALAALLAVAVPAAASTIPAGAASTSKPWYRWSVYDLHAQVENGDPGTHTARLTQILLPSAFTVKKRSSYLAFGPVGACRSTGSIRPVLVRSDATDAAGVLDEQLPESRAVYGEGTRGDAVWRVVNAGTATIRGAYVRPTRMDGVWIVIRIGTTPHGTCHSGGYRESVAFPLADGLATVKASGY
jgi:hypothetical protein